MQWVTLLPGAILIVGRHLLWLCYQLMHMVCIAAAANSYVPPVVGICRARAAAIERHG
jgi:hypothetical protein